MVKVKDIRDKDSLEAWLKALPFDEAENRRIAVTIAHRAAMRVLPVYWRWVLEKGPGQKPDLTAMPVLRLNLISAVAATYPAEDIRAVLAAASRAVASAARPASAASAARAAYAVFAATTDIAFAATTDAAVSAFFTAATGTSWENIRADATLLLPGNKRLDDVPLWSGRNPLADDWATLRKTLSDDWSFWRDWYQDALDGVPPDWDMLKEIALIAPEDWDKGPAHVNPMIGQIVEKHRGKASRSKSSKPINAGQEETSQIALRVHLNRYGLELTVKGLLEQISIYREQLRGKNDLDPEYKESVLDFLDRLVGQLEGLLELLPSPDEDISSVDERGLSGWLKEYRRLLGEEGKRYFTPENVARVTIPTSIIMGFAGVGALVGGPVGGGVGAWIGKMITGEAKPGKAADEIRDMTSADE